MMDETQAARLAPAVLAAILMAPQALLAADESASATTAVAGATEAGEAAALRAQIEVLFTRFQLQY